MLLQYIVTYQFRKLIHKFSVRKLTKQNSKAMAYFSFTTCISLTKIYSIDVNELIINKQHNGFRNYMIILFDVIIIKPVWSHKEFFCTNEILSKQLRIKKKYCCTQLQ